MPAIGVSNFRCAWASETLCYRNGKKVTSNASWAIQGTPQD
jgi:hypothetical protein